MPNGDLAEGKPSRRFSAPAGLAAVASLGLVALIAARALLREIPGVNSYGALADAFLHARLWIERCSELDCAAIDGKTFIIFPPLPAFVAMPFVAVFGFNGFRGFILLAGAAALASLWLWRAVFRALGVEDRHIGWLLVAIAFSSPLFQVTLRGDGVWFFAQAIGFLLMTAAVWAAAARHNLALSGLFIAGAFLCRQMALFYAPFLLVLALSAAKPAKAGAWVKGAALLLIPVAIAVLAFLAYDFARFGSPFDTGYGYIHNPGPETFIARRIAEHGLFSWRYALFNFAYLLIQGAHFEFSGPELTQLTGLDKSGAALFVTSPWLLLLFYTRSDRVLAGGVLSIGAIAGLTLLYHSNGAEQIYTQRYALDWLPIALVLMARTTKVTAFDALPALVAWGVASDALAQGLAAAYRL